MTSKSNAMHPAVMFLLKLVYIFRKIKWHIFIGSLHRLVSDNF